MSKNYISPEHAIKKIMAESYNKHMVKNNQTRYNLFEDNQDPENQQEEDWWETVKKKTEELAKKYGERFSSQEFIDKMKKGVLGGRDNISDYFSDLEKHLDQSTRTKDLGTDNKPPKGSEPSKREPVTTTSTSQPVKTEKPEVKVGYGDGKVDPRLASAAGIGPKLAGSEPPAKPDEKKPSSSVPASAVRPKPAMPDKPRVPNIKLASKLSDLNYTGMGTAARNEYLQKSADKAWAKPTRENLLLRQRAQRQEYGPDR